MELKNRTEDHIAAGWHSAITLAPIALRPYLFK